MLLIVAMFVGGGSRRGVPLKASIDWQLTWREASVRRVAAQFFEWRLSRPRQQIARCTLRSWQPVGVR